MSVLGLGLLEAVQAEVVSEIKSAEANLDILLKRPVGIGEHIDLVTEVHSLIGKITESEDKLNVLSKKIAEFTDEVRGYRVNIAGPEGSSC